MDYKKFDDVFEYWISIAEKTSFKAVLAKEVYNSFPQELEG